MCSITLSEDINSFTSYFPIWIHFISISSLIAITRTSRTILNRSGERGHPCVAPELRGNAFSFSLSSMMLAIGLSYMGNIMWRNVLSKPSFWRVFIISECWIFSKAFSAFFEMITWFLFFNLFIWYIQCWLVYGYWIIFASGINSILSLYMVLLCIVGFCLLVFCWGFLCIYSLVILAWFWYQGNGGLIEWVQECFFFCNSLE